MIRTISIINTSILYIINSVYECVCDYVRVYVVIADNPKKNIANSAQWVRWTSISFYSLVGSVQSGLCICTHAIYVQSRRSSLVYSAGCSLGQVRTMSSISASERSASGMLRAPVTYASGTVANKFTHTTHSFD